MRNSNIQHCPECNMVIVYGECDNCGYDIFLDGEKKSKKDGERYGVERT